MLRFVINDRQTTIQNIGTEIVDFKRTDVIELRDRCKKPYPLLYRTRDPSAGEMQVRRSDEAKIREEQYANWHKFQGVNTPLFVSHYTDGVKMMEIHAETVVYNSGLSDNLFTQLNPSK